MYSVHPGAKPEILDYGAICIQFVLNRRNCIGELDRTCFVTASALCFYKMLSTLSTETYTWWSKSLWGEIFSLFFLFCSSSSLILGDFSRWLWEHNYYFIGKAWMLQQSLTWQQCTEACSIACVRAGVLMGLLVTTINVDPAGNCLLYVRRWGGPGCGQEKRAMWQPQEFYGFLLNKQLQ